MKIGNLDGRAIIVDGNRAIDIAAASHDKFGPDPMRIFDDWKRFLDWAESHSDISGGTPFEEDALLAPVPRPRQVFGIGLNYAKHATESNHEVPADPLVFTKFSSSITGPRDEVSVVSPKVDWEVELVVVIGEECHQVDLHEAMNYVAGYTAGQDISDRELQLAGNVPQFSLGKSYPKFSPIGPVVVTRDEFSAPLELELATKVNGQLMQSGNTSDLVTTIPGLVSYLSSIVTLFPGDLVFTGTPDGVGLGLEPPVFLKEGDVLETYVESIGDMTHTMVG